MTKNQKIFRNLLALVFQVLFLGALVKYLGLSKEIALAILAFCILGLLRKTYHLLKYDEELEEKGLRQYLQPREDLAKEILEEKTESEQL